jgi:hypothetical protein
VIDLKPLCGLPSKEAKQAEARRIKHLARLNAAFAQSYPQKTWTERKVLFNHALAAFLSSRGELVRLS